MTADYRRKFPLDKIEIGESKTSPLGWMGFLVFYPPSKRGSPCLKVSRGRLVEFAYESSADEQLRKESVLCECFVVVVGGLAGRDGIAAEACTDRQPRSPMG